MVINIVWIKYVPFIIVGLAIVWAVYKIITTKHLLEFVKQSMCGENGKPSGRSIAGFACINAMLVGFFVSIYYAKDHTPPDWYVETLAFLIGSFYGMKEIGKFATRGKTDPAQVMSQEVNQPANQPEAKPGQPGNPVPPAQDDAT